MNILEFANIQSVSASCFGDSSGTIVIEADTNFGFPPYQFFIDNTNTSDTINNLPQGSYTLNISDNIGCISDDTVITILQPDSLYACGDNQTKVRILLESLGLENVVAKSLGSNNSLNMAKAALNGLLKLKSLEENKKNLHDSNNLKNHDAKENQRIDTRNLQENYKKV